MHAWEVVTDDTGLPTGERMEVPGGWIYRVSIHDDGEHFDAAVFVPTPTAPRRVHHDHGRAA